MNIKILDSWLRDYLKTEAKIKTIADVLSLTSVSVERMEPYGKDFICDIEVTTNRPDLMSVVGLAREAAVVLEQAGHKAEFVHPKIKEIEKISKRLNLEIKVDEKLVNRICAIALNVKNGQSPEYIKERLQTTDINPHNNIVDVTNYVMREIGHPMHAFDLDKLTKTGKMIIREAKKGEEAIDLHGIKYSLMGGDIVADDGTGVIIDILAIVGTQNSSIDENTSNVLLFVDNDNQHKIRKTSMSLGIRTDAAVLNEKGVDPELALTALARGVELLEEIAEGKQISDLLDIYPNKPKQEKIKINQAKIDSIIGIKIPVKTSAIILEKLGFEVKVEQETIHAVVPSWRANDVSIPEDLIEEIARVYGYDKVPTLLPPSDSTSPYNQEADIFYWERRIRDAMKYWGFNEVYTYPMVSENLLEKAPEDSLTIKNPLTEDMVYMRTSLVPSLLEATKSNNSRVEQHLYELANVYIKKPKNLPEEKLKLAGVVKKPKASFLEVKGLVETLFKDLGINNTEFKKAQSGTLGATVFVGKDSIGEIEVLEQDLIDFELDFESIFKNVKHSKTYNQVSKFPEAIEDLRFEIDPEISFDTIVKNIKMVNPLIKRVELLDVYQNKKTFRIVYQSMDKNLTSEDITPIRESVISSLKKSLKATAS